MGRVEGGGVPPAAAEDCITIKAATKGEVAACIAHSTSEMRRETGSGVRNEEEERPSVTTSLWNVTWSASPKVALEHAKAAWESAYTASAPASSDQPVT